MNRFDVNDPELRESFLRREVAAALERLTASSVARWGRMSPRQMVEHLVWGIEVSKGRAEVAWPVPPDEILRMKKFLYNNRATPQEFMNPALVEGLPPLRYVSLDEAKVALERELDRFLAESSSDELRVHPIFGPISHEEWHRGHYKHIRHHLLQFGLIEEDPLSAPANPARPR